MLFHTPCTVFSSELAIDWRFLCPLLLRDNRRRLATPAAFTDTATRRNLVHQIHDSCASTRLHRVVSKGKVPHRTPDGFRSPPDELQCLACRNLSGAHRRGRGAHAEPRCVCGSEARNGLTRDCSGCRLTLGSRPTTTAVMTMSKAGKDSAKCTCRTPLGGADCWPNRESQGLLPPFFGVVAANGVTLHNPSRWKCARMTA
jgi:hypothetical protein